MSQPQLLLLDEPLAPWITNPKESSPGDTEA